MDVLMKDSGPISHGSALGIGHGGNRTDVHRLPSRRYRIRDDTNACGRKRGSLSPRKLSGPSQKRLRHGPADGGCSQGRKRDALTEADQGFRKRRRTWGAEGAIGEDVVDATATPSSTGENESAEVPNHIPAGQHEDKSQSFPQVDAAVMENGDVFVRVLHQNGALQLIKIEPPFIDPDI
jgi:hypothetical protein